MLFKLVQYTRTLKCVNQKRHNRFKKQLKEILKRRLNLLFQKGVGGTVALVGGVVGDVVVTLK